MKLIITIIAFGTIFVQAQESEKIFLLEILKKIKYLKILISHLKIQ